MRESLARIDDARSLLRDLFRSKADLLPDLEQAVWRIHVHPMSNPRPEGHRVEILTETGTRRLSTTMFVYVA